VQWCNSASKSYYDKELGVTPSETGWCHSATSLVSEPGDVGQRGVYLIKGIRSPANDLNPVSLH
jgi:hypothetical protein